MERNRDDATTLMGEIERAIELATRLQLPTAAFLLRMALLDIRMTVYDELAEIRRPDH